MRVVNAIDYLKEGRVFKEKTHEWIYPLIEEYLKGCMVTNNLIEDHIDKKADLSFKIRDKANKESVLIKKIAEISEIKNMGFIEIDKQPLTLNDCLNIFYGKNGSGKSTIYKALVNTLGDEHVKSNSNIHNTDTNVSVKIKVSDFKDVDKIIHYTNTQKLFQFL